MASKNSIQVFIDAQTRLQGVEKTAKDFQKIFDNMVIDQSLRTKIDEAFKLAFKDLGKYSGLLEKAISGTASGKELRDLAKEGKNVEHSLKAIQKIYNGFDDAALTKAFDTKNVNGQIAKTREQIKQLQQQVLSFGSKGKGSNAIGNLIEKINLQEGPYNQILKSKQKGKTPTTIEWLKDIQQQFIKAGSINDPQKAIEAYEKALDKLESVRARLQNTSEKTTDPTKKGQYAALLQEVNNIINAYRTLDQVDGKPLESIKELQTKLASLSAENVKGLVQAARQAGTTFDGATVEVSQFNDEVGQTGSGMAKMRGETEQLLSQFTRFTTLAGIFEVFRRSIRSAFESVKELDAAMNSIAVVTDKKTDELWGAIEKYTDMANRTGSTIAGTYQVSQLYYQQGLGDSEVDVMTEETLKMARIAGIEYAEATDYMTAAIKGFGLAYEEVTHISDVYSNLAAKTATDTEEIAIAMSKVASIAHSTGMEMETTAAMLAQILEVTREAPETAGTALKTVIARFGEVKTLIEKGETTGTDEEGEAIDVNRIDAALKTAGMSLLDEAGQMRDLDDVLLELSSRWSSLSDMQQRYIATQAAGSRQQSRFLALMNDYQGLMKMVGYATDSAGASQAQFDKTLESLESKLNNLNNAWTSFTTGITNQTVIKGTVDILTKLLTVINEGTSLFGDFGTSIIRAVGLFGALRLAGKATGSALVKSGFAKESDNLIQGLGTLSKIDGSGLKKVSSVFENIGKGNSFKLKDILESIIDTDSFKSEADKLKSIFSGIFEIDDEKTSKIKDLLEEVKSAEELDYDWIENFLNMGDGPVESEPSNTSIYSNLFAQTERLGISQRQLNAIRESGLSIDQQALLLSSRTLAVQAAEIISNTNLTETERAEALARLQESAATGISTAATIKNTAAKLANTKVIGKVIQVITGLKPAANTGKVAITSMGQAIGVFAAAAGVALAVIGAITAAIVIWYRQTNAFETKKAQAALKSLQEAANSAKASLEDLESALESFEGKQNAFDGLIQGTDAWNKALFEANQQVLELISTYPELAKYMTTGEFGQLTISQEGWDETISNQRKIAQRTSAASAMSQGQVESLRYDKLISEAAKDLRRLGITVNDGQEVGETYLSESYAYAADSIQEYNNLLYQQKEAVSSYNKAAVSAMIEAEYATYEYADSIKEAFSKENFDFTSKNSGFLMGKYTSLQDALTKEEIAGRGSRKKNLKALYAELSGIDYDDVDIDNKDDLKYAISELLGAKKLDEAVDDFTKRMVKLNDKMAAAVNGVMTEGESWTKEDIDFYSENGIGNSLQEQAKALGYIDEDGVFDSINYAKAMGFKNFATLQSTMQERVKQYKNFFDNLETELTNLTGIADKKWIPKNLTISLGNQLRDTFNNLSKEGINAAEFEEFLANTLNSVSDEDKLSVLQSLISTDYKVVDSIDSTIEALESMGIETSGLRSQMIELGQASAQVDLDKLSKKLSSLKEVIDTIGDRENFEKTFSYEEMNELISKGVASSSDFVLTGLDEYTYTNSLDTLSNEAYGAAAALLELQGAAIRGETTISEQAYAKYEQDKEAGNAAYSSMQDIANRKNYFSLNPARDRQQIVSTLQQYGLDYQLDENGQVTKTDLSSYGIQELAQLFVDRFDQYITGHNGIMANQATWDSTYNKYALTGQTGSYSTQYGEIGSSVKDPMMGKNMSEYDQYLNAMIGSTEGAASTLGQLEKALGKSGTSVKALTMEYTKNQKEIDKVNEALEDNEDALKNSGTDEYNKAINETTEAMQDAFGSHITEDFVKQHLKDIDEMSESQEAFDKVMEASGEAWINSFANSNQEISNNLQSIQSQMAAIDGSQMAVTMSADTTQYANALLEAGMTADQLVAFYDSIGWSAVMSYDEEGNITAVDLVRNSGGGTKGYSGGGGGGGGGGGKKAEPQQDRFYNYIKNLEGVEREMEKLQDEMELLLDPEAIGENLDAQSDKFAELIGSNQSYLNALDVDMAKMQASMTSKFGKYITFAEDGTIRLTEAYYNASGSIVEEMDAWIEEYDDLIGRTDDLEGAIRDLKKEATDFFNNIRDSAIDLTDELADILKERDEKALEEKEKYYEELEKKDDKYLEAIRENIEAERKARDRANSYEDLGKKQSKLALLQRDTSGLYANEISSLQEEINQTQQDLADEQIDGILDAIEKENADAAERHDEILKAMQEQIDSNVENRYYIQQAEEAIKLGYEAVETILMSGQEYQEASDAKRDQLLEGLKSDFANASWYFTSGYRSAADYLANIMNSYLYDQTSRIVAAIGDIKFPSVSTGGGGGGGVITNDGNGEQKGWVATVTGYNTHSKKTQTYTTKKYANQGDAGTEALGIVKKWQKEGIITNIKTSYKYYKTGGLVDYTGPAWVDGTKSRPEAFLNPEQTQIIRQLAENLVRPNSPFSPGITNSTTNNANCEINIEIGSIGNNVNIDEAIEKIKNEIIQSTQYRNVTVLTRKR